jgi:hypothetical protein
MRSAAGGAVQLLSVSRDYSVEQTTASSAFAFS